jgi:hypothetical protein
MKNRTFLLLAMAKKLQKKFISIFLRKRKIQNEKKNKKMNETVI